MKNFFKLLLIIFFYACQKSNLTIEPGQMVAAIGPNVLPQKWIYTEPAVNNGNNIHDIFFSDSSFGAFISNSELFTSSDGGTNWKKYDNPSFVNKGYRFYNMFINKKRDIFLIGGQDRILQIRNDSVMTVSVKGIAKDIYFLNDTIGYAITTSGLLQTKNAGSSWTQVGKNINSIENKDLSSLFFLNNGKGLITTTSKAASNLANDTIWSELPLQLPNIYSVYMTSQSDYYLSTESRILKTTDGGKTFKSTFSFPTLVKGYVDLHFVDANTGYFCAGNSIYKTTNAGDIWERILILRENSNEYIIEVHFVSPTKGWACTSLGGILKFN